MTKRPRHGVDALGHGYTPDCDKHGETCNNVQCRLNLPHAWCTEECSGLVERDRNGTPWQPGHVPDQLKDLSAE